MKRIIIFALFLLLHHTAVSQYSQYQNSDPRLVSNGHKLPSRNYADQPRIIVCNDGSWLAILTTSSGTEHAHMNHVISTKSYDQGKTWTEPQNVEAPGVPQSSWAVPLKVPNGRIYVFYNFNKHRFSGVEGVYS